MTYLHPLSILEIGYVVNKVRPMSLSTGGPHTPCVSTACSREREH